MISSERVRELLVPHGTCSPQDSSDWTGDIPLPSDIAEFYRDVGPLNINIEGVGNPILLPCLSDLWERQAGYRWDGLSGDPIPGWDDSWIVVADEGADPFIFSQGRVLFAYHGQGSWDPGEMYPDLNSMAACMALMGSVVLSAGDQLLDEEFRVREEFKAEAITGLQEVLGSKNEAESIVEFSGWG